LRILNQVSFQIDIIVVCDKAVDFRGCVNEVLQKLIEAAQNQQNESEDNESASDDRVAKRFSPHNFGQKGLVRMNKLRRMKIKHSY